VCKKYIYVSRDIKSVSEIYDFFFIKEWAKIRPALALRTLRSVVLQFTNVYIYIYIYIYIYNIVLRHIPHNHLHTGSGKE
jgi:hypothetical protein